MKLKNDLVISEELYKKLAPTGSRPGILYGLPKIINTVFPYDPSNLPSNLIRIV